LRPSAAKIDKVVMIDNGNGNGSSGLNRFAQTAPTMIFSLLQQLQAMGLTMPEVMAQLGIKYDEKLIETDKNAEQNPSAEKEVKLELKNKKGESV
jgi:hypothetical protein